jgi:hypothetical protein
VLAWILALTFGGVLGVRLFESVADRLATLVQLAIVAAARRIGIRDDGIMTLFGMYGAMLVIFVAILVAVFFLLTAVSVFTDLPASVAAFAASQGMTVEANFFHVLVPVLIALVISAGASAWWHFLLWAYDQADVRENGDDEKLDPEVLASEVASTTRKAQVAREYAWALTTVAVAVIPAAFVGGWAVNVLASVLFPLLVVAARLDYARRRTAPPPAEGSLRAAGMEATTPVEGKIYVDKGTDGGANYGCEYVRTSTDNRVGAGIILFVSAMLSLLFAGDVIVDDWTDWSRLESTSALLCALTLGDLAWPWIRRERLRSLREAPVEDGSVTDADPVAAERRVAVAGEALQGQEIAGGEASTVPLDPRTAKGSAADAQGDLHHAEAMQYIDDHTNDRGDQARQEAAAAVELSIIARQWAGSERDRVVAREQMMRSELARARAETAAALARAERAAATLRVLGATCTATAIAIVGVAGTIFARRDHRPPRRVR